MKKPNLAAVALFAISGLGALALPSAALAWTRAYVVEYAEPAMYYGAADGLIEAGTDCPKGTVAEPNWPAIFTAAGYTPEESVWMRNPANPLRNPIHGNNQVAFRGKDRANVYAHPTSIAESGTLYPVTGALAEGIDLDGVKTNGFTSLTGEKGVDNNFYKALGCWKTYRGPERQASGPLSMNGYMQDGLFTIAIVVSGAGADPMNDDNVQVGFYDSTDKMVKDANGAVAAGYTFSVRPSSKYEAMFKAKTVGGKIISTEAMDEVWMREASYTRELQLLKARLDLTIQPDGKLKGYVAGYRPWLPVYASWVAARGPVIESLTWVQLPDVYYALRRHADYSPSGAQGDKTHISFALRVDAVPAYVMNPDGMQQVAGVSSYKPLASGPEPRPMITKWNVVDGIVLPDGQTVARSYSAEEISPPALRTASAQ